MKLSERDAELLEIAKGLPADVLCLAAKIQARNNMLSEAWCTEIGDAWHEAAEIARERRSTPNDRISSTALFSGNPLRNFAQPAKI